MFGRRFWEAGNFAQGSSGEDALGLIFAFTRLDLAAGLNGKARSYK
jgi:hypothetical protein